ncbi:hypothetical protein C8J57DRAFT_1317974, partial [Mycena rebaudengoi]
PHDTRPACPAANFFPGLRRLRPFLWRADVASPPRAIEAHNALLQHFMIFDLHAPAANFFAGLRLRVRRHPPARADVAPPPRAIEAQTALLYHSLILVLHAPCFTCLLDAIPAGHPMPIRMCRLSSTPPACTDPACTDPVRPPRAIGAHEAACEHAAMAVLRAPHLCSLLRSHLARKSDPPHVLPVSPTQLAAVPQGLRVP